MPISRGSKLFAVQDAGISALTTDPEGGTATYGVIQDVPGIKSVTITPNLENKELRGDNKRLDSSSILIGCTAAFSHARIHLDVLRIMLGGTVADAGTTPAQTSTFSRLGTDSVPAFKFQARTPTGGGDIATGAARLVLYKCVVSSYELGFAEEDYQIFSGEMVCSYQLGNNKLMDLILEETATVLA